MANAALFVGWGAIARGQEAKALELFNESQAYYARLQQEGQIESFEPVILDPHGGDLAGFMLLRGERSALDAIQSSDENQTLTVRANLILDNFGVIRAAIGQELADGIARFQKAAAG